MTLKIITVGDKTDHGGTVISGPSANSINGKAVARLGDKVACPLVYPGGKPHGINKIIKAYETLMVGGVVVTVKGRRNFFADVQARKACAIWKHGHDNELGRN